MDKQQINNTGLLSSLLISLLLMGSVSYAPVVKANELQSSVPQVTSPHQQLAYYYGWHHRNWRYFHHRCHKRCWVNRWGHLRCHRRCWR